MTDKTTKEDCKLKMAQSNEWWNNELKKRIEKAIKTRDQQWIEAVNNSKPQFIKKGRVEYGNGWCDGRNQLRTEIIKKMKL